MRITVSVTNNNPDTIWNRLALKFGREPTNAEASAEVKRILTDAVVDRATQGKLLWQR